MPTRINRWMNWRLAPLGLLLLAGCDAADIVFASLDLAFAIADAAS